MRECENCIELATSWVCDTPGCPNFDGPALLEPTQEEIDQAVEALEKAMFGSPSGNICIAGDDEENISDSFKVLPRQPVLPGPWDYEHIEYEEPKQYGAMYNISEQTLVDGRMSRDCVIFHALNRVLHDIGKEIGWDLEVFLLDPREVGDSVFNHTTVGAKATKPGRYKFAPDAFYKVNLGDK